MDVTLPEQILEDILRVKIELGLTSTPTRDQYIDHETAKFGKAAIGEAFGSWTRMLLVMGERPKNRGKGVVDKQEKRRRYYEHLLKELERVRTEAIEHPPARSLLVIGDFHAPYGHPDYVAFLIALRDRYLVDRTCCVDDLVDYHAISFHDSDPDLMSPGHELEAAIKQLQPLYEAFPTLDLAESNHSSLVFRKGKHHGLPRQVLASYHEQLRCPPGWRWHFEINVPLSNGTSVLIHHSYGANVLNQSRKRGRSLIQGHHHTEAGVQWWGNANGEFFAAFTGCGIDDKALAFAYNKNQVERPRLGALIVVEGVPSWKPMILDKNGRWTGFIS